MRVTSSDANLSRANAAIEYHPAGCRVSTQVKGRETATAGLLCALARFAEADKLYCYTRTESDFATFCREVAEPRQRVARWIRPGDHEALGEAGCLFRPDPLIIDLAWRRRYASPTAYSICGVTHTICSANVLDGIGALATGPVEPWDAVICASQSVKAVITGVLEQWTGYLGERLQTTVASRLPQFPVIPLGIDCDSFAPTEARIGAGRALRRQLRIGDDDFVMLYVGRLSYHAKAHPWPMYLAAEEAARQTGKRLHLLHVGWFANDTLEWHFVEGARQHCPSVNAIFLKETQGPNYDAAWHAADLFISLVDNIQESFGLTPIEAMAAGLPVVVSDWDGYRDTVRPGVDGFRIPTTMPAAGAGRDLAFRYAAGLDDYDRYIGNVSQFTAVDVASCVSALVALINSLELRRKLGAAGQRSAREQFDWSVIIPRYQELWAELGERRKTADVSLPNLSKTTGVTTAPPLDRDPFRDFAPFATQQITADSIFNSTAGASDGRLETFYHSPLSFAGQHMASQETCAAILARLAEQGPSTTRELAHGVEIEVGPSLFRTLGWLAKTDLIQVIGLARISPLIKPATIPVAQNEIVASANQLLQRGKVGEAITLLAKTLPGGSYYPGAMHRLGLVYQSQRKLTEAIDAFNRSVQADATCAEVWNDLGCAQWHAKLLADAQASFRRAAEVDPSFAPAHSNLGCVIKAAGDVAGALPHYERAIKLAPDLVDAHNNLGGALQALGRLDEAAQAFRRAVSIQPSYADGYSNLGAVLKELGRLDDAVAFHRTAIGLKTENPKFHFNLAVVLHAQEKHEAAVASYERCLALDVNYADAHNNLGCALRKLERLDEAVAAFQKAVALRPDLADAHANLGCALHAQEKVADAVASLNEAIRLKPDHAEALYNRGLIQHQQGELDLAITSYDEAIHVKPDYPDAHLGKSFVLLSRGQFSEGWPEYEWRLKYKEGARTFDQPMWDGSPLNGRTILIHIEQGLGDTLQFVRFAPLVQALGGKVLLGIQKVLGPLFTASGYGDLIVRGTSIPPFDVHAPLLSLPALLNTSLETLPTRSPYLATSAALVQHWREQLGAIDEFKIGIVWQGNPKYLADKARSIPLAAFEQLARLPGVRLFSLQKGAGTEQLADVAGRWPITDLGTTLDDNTGAFLETAAVMKNLDLVISSDTSAAHLAGGLGVPVWLGLSTTAEWRWLLNREDSPWYPSMKLFRQRRAGAWTEVLERMAEELSSALEKRRGRPASPRSSINGVAAHLARGRSLRAGGDLVGAEREYRAALAIDPGSADAHYLLGLHYQSAGRPQDAIPCYEAALIAKPDHARAANDLGCALAALNRPANQVAAAFARVLEIDPNFPDAHNNLGCTLRSLGRYPEAESQLRRAIELKPNFADAYNNLGNVLQDQDRLDEAADVHRQAGELAPNHPEVANSLGSLAQRRGEFAAALTHYERAIELNPRHVEAHYSRALLWLSEGDYARGWPEFEWRLKSKRYASRDFGQPMWDGSPLEGRKLLIHTEQGFGDTLQFVRYLPLLADSGGEVIVEVQPALLPLLKASGYSGLVARAKEPPLCDVHLPLMSLPWAFRTKGLEVPGASSYLTADPALVVTWRERLASIDSFKIGINWQGSPTYRDDRNRSIPLREFAPLAAVPGVRLISLQRKHGLEQLAEHASRFSIVDLGPDVDESAGPFMDTAAIMQSLDLVITSDTVTAHLAGALGVPVWVVLPRNAEWRWMRSRDDSPWYPTMRLFRQFNSSDWGEPLRQIAIAAHIMGMSCNDGTP